MPAPPRHRMLRLARACARAAAAAGRALAGALALALVLGLVAVAALALAGLRPSTEHSGSMAPQLMRGDLIFSSALAARQVRVGDVVTFPDPYARGVLLTHRVLTERAQPGGLIAFTTRGDANRGSEHWATAAGGRLTRVAFSVPLAGLAVLALQSHPLAPGLALALALWLLLLPRIWSPRVRSTAPRTRPQRGVRRARVTVLAACAGALALLGAGAAVAYVAAPHKAGAGPVALALNDGGEPLFELHSMSPGERAIACERVQNKGPAAAEVGIYAATGGSGLQRLLTLTVERGALPAAAGPGSCAGFAPDTGDGSGLGAGVLYRGPMASFPSSQASALADPSRAWPAGSAVGYRMTVALGQDNAAQGLGATQQFFFGARPASPGEGGGPGEGPAQPPQGAGVDPPGGVAGRPGAAAPAPLTAVLQRASASGALTFRVGLPGPGALTAAAWAARRVHVRAGTREERERGAARIVLVALGRAFAREPAGGSAQLTIRARHAALADCRALRERCRLLVRFLFVAASGPPSALAMWLPGRVLAARRTR